MDIAFLKEQITATKAQILEAQNAQSALLADQIFSYSMDTGQGRTTVTKQTVGQLNALIDSLYNRLTTLQARLNGDNVLIVRPGY